MMCRPAATEKIHREDAKERKVFEIAFLRVFAVKMSLIAGSGGFTSSCANQTAFAAWAHNQTRTRPLPGW